MLDLRAQIKSQQPQAAPLLGTIC